MIEIPDTKSAYNPQIIKDSKHSFKYQSIPIVSSFEVRDMISIISADIRLILSMLIADTNDVDTKNYWPIPRPKLRFQTMMVRLNLQCFTNTNIITMLYHTTINTMLRELIVTSYKRKCVN